MTKEKRKTVINIKSSFELSVRLNSKNRIGCYFHLKTILDTSQIDRKNTKHVKMHLVPYKRKY